MGKRLKGEEGGRRSGAEITKGNEMCRVPSSTTVYCKHALKKET